MFCVECSDGDSEDIVFQFEYLSYEPGLVSRTWHVPRLWLLRHDVISHYLETSSTNRCVKNLHKVATVEQIARGLEVAVWENASTKETEVGYTNCGTPTVDARPQNVLCPLD